MTQYEHLEQHAYDQGIVVINKEFDDHGPQFSGLYFKWEGHLVIFINKKRTTAEQTIALMEELAHHELAVGDIIDQTKTENRKAEALTRATCYKKLLPSIINAILTGHTMPWEISELTDIPESTINEILTYCAKKNIAI